MHAVIQGNHRLHRTFPMLLYWSFLTSRGFFWTTVYLSLLPLSLSSSTISGTFIVPTPVPRVCFSISSFPFRRRCSNQVIFWFLYHLLELVNITFFELICFALHMYYILFTWIFTPITSVWLTLFFLNFLKGQMRCSPILFLNLFWPALDPYQWFTLG